jgi:hypothetical protein
MAEVIELERFRRKMAADQGFRTWLSRFREQFGPETRLKDLSNPTLLFLATPGEENLYVFFDLVMGARGWGTSVRFRLDDLDSAKKHQVLDIALGMLDRTRFEVMRRLGWVDRVPGEEHSLIQLLQDAQRQVLAFDQQIPVLSSHHPDFLNYQTLPLSERGTFLRRLIPSALAEFRRQVEEAEETPP